MYRWLWLMLLCSTPAFSAHQIVKLSCRCPERLKGHVIIRQFATDPTLVVIDTQDVAQLAALPSVQYVVADHPIRLIAPVTIQSADAGVPYSLALTQADQLHARGIVGDPKLIVAVVDTGSSPDHPELQGRVLAGKNFVTSGPGVDDNGHGTHVSGTIAGLHVGFAPAVQILPAKFLDRDGSGSLEAALSAIDYAVQQGARILSNSWGGGPLDRPMLDLIRKAEQRGVLFVAAAGNDGQDNDQTPSYPSGYLADNVVAVAATDQRDLLASFSNYGLRSVHVAAPGVAILSSYLGGKYAKLSGTSMATPAITGTAALMMSVNPRLTPRQIRDILVETADPIDGLSGASVSRGRLNALKAVETAQRTR